MNKKICLSKRITIVFVVVAICLSAVGFSSYLARQSNIIKSEAQEVTTCTANRSYSKATKTWIYNSNCCPNNDSDKKVCLDSGATPWLNFLLTNRSNKYILDCKTGVIEKAASQDCPKSLPEKSISITPKTSSNISPTKIPTSTTSKQLPICKINDENKYIYPVEWMRLCCDKSDISNKEQKCIYSYHDVVKNNNIEQSGYIAQYTLNCGEGTYFECKGSCVLKNNSNELNCDSEKAGPYTIPPPKIKVFAEYDSASNKIKITDGDRKYVVQITIIPAQEACWNSFIYGASDWRNYLSLENSIIKIELINDNFYIKIVDTQFQDRSLTIQDKEVISIPLGKVDQFSLKELVLNKFQGVICISK